MTSAPSFFPCVSRDELREKKRQEEEAQKPKQPDADQVCRMIAVNCRMIGVDWGIIGVDITKCKSILKVFWALKIKSKWLARLTVNEGISWYYIEYKVFHVFFTMKRLSCDFSHYVSFISHLNLMLSAWTTCTRTESILERWWHGSTRGVSKTIA